MGGVRLQQGEKHTQSQEVYIIIVSDEVRYYQIFHHDLIMGMWCMGMWCCSTSALL
jgi:hypothetical protein